ncbi:MAG: FlgO family outer membrane protein, partial [Alphaproteobacteria bacterium]
MLTERELMIAGRYARGETYKEIAAQVHIAPATVRNHLAAVYRKLEVKNKPGLIRALSNETLARNVPSAPTVPILLNLEDSLQPPSGGASIAVMSFANIGPAENEYFGHGVATDIQHYLTRCHDLLVSGLSSAIAMSGLARDATEVAKRLGVQYVLQGTVRTRQDKVRLTAELVDGASGAVLWSERYDRMLNDILEIEAEVAGAITANLSLKIEETQYERQRHLSDDQLSAYDLRLRGNRFLELAGKNHLERARDCFTNALMLEPVSAPAFAGLSISYGYECDQLVTENYGGSLERHV